MMYVVMDLHVWVSFTHETAMFQVFQLTALVIRGPATHVERSIIKLNRVAVKEGEMCGVRLCVQDTVRSRHFTQRSCFLEFEMTMTFESLAIADSIASSSVFVPRSLAGKACAGQVMSGLRGCWDWVVLRRGTAKDPGELRYHGGNPRGEISSGPVARTSYVVEEGRVEYPPVTSPAAGLAGPSKIQSSLSKWKGKDLPKLREFASETLDNQ